MSEETLTGQKPRRQTNKMDLPARAYQRLRELIVHGRLAPGSRVVETEVADRLGLSRTPVRSALQRLQQEGYVLADSEGRQTRLWVAPLTEEDARELFSIVGEMEGLAAGSAARLPPGQRDALVQTLRALNERLLTASHARSPDADVIFDLDMEFHRTYVMAGARSRLRALHEAFKPQAERYVRLYVRALMDEIDISVEEHEATIRAIEAALSEEAHSSVRTNWRNASDRLSRVIQSAGERGSW